MTQSRQGELRERREREACAGEAPEREVRAGEAPDLVSIHWCAPAVRESLESAARGLRSLLSDPEPGAAAAPDPDPDFQAGSGRGPASAVRAAALRHAWSSVHRANGALVVAGLEGVPAVTAEAERLLEAIERETVVLDEAAVTAFARASHAVGEYLDGLLSGAPPRPLYLFSYYRDLMAARGIDRPNPADLLPISSSAAAHPGLSDAGSSGKGAAELTAARGNFERALLKLLRAPHDGQALRDVYEAVEIVACSRQAAGQDSFWRAALACCQAWRDGTLALDVAGKRLLARINLQMRQTVAEGGPVAERLLAETLFVLAGARAGSPLVEEMRRRFLLDDAVPEDYEIPHFEPVDPGLIEAARQALTRAKSAWEAPAGGAAAAAARMQTAETFATALSAFPFAGLRALGPALVEASRGGAAPDEEAHDSAALAVAAVLLHVEQMLDHGLGRVEAKGRFTGPPAIVSPLNEWIAELDRSNQEHAALVAFVAETRVVLDAVEQTLDAFFRDASERDGLAPASLRLREAAGALRLLDLEEAGRVAMDVASQIDTFAEVSSGGVAHPEGIAGRLAALGFFVDGLLVPGQSATALSTWLEQAQALTGEPQHALLENDRELLDIFLGEADEVFEVLREAIEALKKDPADTDALAVARRGFHTLKGSGRLVGLSGLGDAACAIEETLDRWLSEARDASEELTGLMDHAVGMFRGWIDGLRDRPEGVEIDPAAIIAAAEAVRGRDKDQETDLLPLFVEEATDLLPRIGENLRRWHADRGNREVRQLLMRELHTLKGSARVAGVMDLGQSVHEMETCVEVAANQAVAPLALIEALIAAHDEIVAMFEAIARSSAATGSSGNGAQQELVMSPTSVLPDEAAGAVGATGAAMVRVRADLLDRLVTGSGEVSIVRSRLEDELAGVRESLQDLTVNVGRLRGHLVELETRGESRIPAPGVEPAPNHSGFDPLELDRYTRFQELARQLAESVDDVATVHQSAMRNLDRATEDLGRQRQVLRELQQNVMRMRMVRFDSIADRLHRVARQAAEAVGKRVSMKLRGAAVEIDRSVLERMAAPIEHLLRNAVVHGIEAPAARAASGKAETGEISLDLRHEGNEAVLVVEDDGLGLDHARITSRARANGIVGPDDDVPEGRTAELIFEPGFSTAEAIDEISGRGVGLDVVRAEVDALGGRIETDSRSGAGTRFTVHLPLSLALTQIVPVSVGTTQYAIASSTIEQVLQLDAPALAAARVADSIEWQGAHVPLHDLGALLGTGERASPAQRHSPVVVIRSGTRRIAVQVDAIGRNQEAVLKNVGAQVSRVASVSGATVLGNGEIVLILNVMRLAEAALEVASRDGAFERMSPRQPAQAPTVMVVDDSLTVRKVTQRLLVRRGYDVMLARDGVDALSQLQDRIPDVMLVDVEMPRMNGFDLTRNVRGDERYRGMPIVMITSRAADKHRDHAMALGVDVYLGKPYRDEELLGHVGAFVRARGAAIDCRVDRQATGS